MLDADARIELEQLLLLLVEYDRLLDHVELVRRAHEVGDHELAELGHVRMRIVLHLDEQHPHANEQVAREPMAVGQHGRVHVSRAVAVAAAAGGGGC